MKFGNRKESFIPGLIVTNDDECQQDGVYHSESDIELNPENGKAVKEGEKFDSTERQILTETY
jgi:hypothetical protein